MRLPGPDEVVRRLRTLDGASVGAGVADDEIARAEEELGTPFPPGYRFFLRELGWARAGGLTIHGLGEGSHDVVRATEELRGPASRRALAIARDDADTFCLDSHYDGAYESPVYRCRAGGDLSPEDYVAHDFTSWLWLRLAGEGG